MLSTERPSSGNTFGRYAEYHLAAFARSAAVFVYRFCPVAAVLLALSAWTPVCGQPSANAAVQDTTATPPAFDLPQAGQLPVTYFSSRAWPFGTSAWNATQDEHGLIYVATGGGVLVYDGTRWTGIDAGMLVRSLAAAPDGRIYVGGQGDIGYLAPDAQGSLAFRSLLDHIPDSSQTFTDVWTTVAHQGGITFQTMTQLMHWDGEAITVTAYSEPEHSVALLSVVQGRLWGVTATGVVEVTADKAAAEWVPVPGTGSRIIAVLDGGPGYFITMTAEGAMARCAFDAPPGASCLPWAEATRATFREGRPFVGLTLERGVVAIGFDGEGVALLHPDGTLLRWLTEEDGLQNTEVMHLFEDREGVLWLGLYAGLAQAHVNTPLTVFGKPEGIPSSVTDVVSHNGRVYASTMLGLRTMVQEGSRARFAEVPGEDPSAYVNCAEFARQASQLLLACGATIYSIRDGGATPVAEVSTAEEGSFFNILASGTDTTSVYASTEISLLRYRRAADALIRTSELEGLRQAYMLAEESTPGARHIWAYSEIDGLARAAMGDSSAHLVWQLTEQDGLPQQINSIRWHGDRLLVFSDQVVLAAEPQGEGGYRLVPSTAFAALEVPSRTRHLYQDEASRYWVFSDSAMTVWQYDTPGAASRIRASHLPALASRQPYGISGNDPIWAASDDGLLRYAMAQDPRLAGTESFPVYIRQARTLQGDSLLYGGHKTAEWTAPQLPYVLNDLRFTYAAPLMGNAGTVQYRVRLDGLERAWSAWTEEAQKDYTNLSPGAYVLRVQARLSDGRMSIVDTLPFQVLPPWYRTWWAYLVWSLLFASAMTAIVRAYNRFRTRRLEAERRVLERQVAARTEELEQRNIHLRELNETLELRTVELRASLEQNKQILGITAHDLKNPLGGIHALAEMLADDFHDFPAEECVEQVELIRDEAKRTLTIIRDMLDRYRQDAASADEQDIRLDQQPTALEPLVRNVVRWNKRQAIAKRMTIRFIPTVRPSVLVDTGALQRAIDNLISNAIKYSPEGSAIRVTLDEATQGSLMIRVHDEGPGLTESDKRRVFGKLQRLSATPTGGEHSTGLGLFIVQRLVEAHGGTVGVESTVGEGATFWIQLPQEVVLERALARG